MKAMIFAAGLGTRFKPLTNNMPKAMVPVGGKPLLQHTIEKLKKSGFDEIIINIHHFADQIIDFISSKNSFDIRIEFSDERDMLLVTGGGIKKASHFFNDDKPFLIHNVDILSNIDLMDLYTHNINTNAIATLACSDRKTSRYLLFNLDNHLKGRINEETGKFRSSIPGFLEGEYKKLAFTGIHVLNPSIFKYMESFSDKFSIIDFYINISNLEEITGYTPENVEMIDVGKMESLEKAERFMTVCSKH